MGKDRRDQNYCLSNILPKLLQFLEGPIDERHKRGRMGSIA